MAGEIKLTITKLKGGSIVVGEVQEESGGDEPTPVSGTTRVWWSSDENDYDDYLIEGSMNYETLVSAGLMEPGSGTERPPCWVSNPYKVEIGSGSQANPLTIIDNNAFYYCTNMTSVLIPYGITTLNMQAFIGCHGLTNITIPSSVTSIKSDSFFDCINLMSVTFIGKTVSQVNSMTYKYWSLPSGCIITCTDGDIEIT